MLKKELREIYKAKRNSLSEELVKEKSKLVATLFIKNFLSEQPLNIHIFLPIEHKIEINTWEIINTIFSYYPQHKIIVSKSNLLTCELSHFVLTKNTLLKLNSWDIPEPEQGETFNISEIDQVLAPLLCFDKTGNRVGYGKGFYDKFLIECNKSVQKIGLSFFEPSEMIEDTLPTDIKMNFCITPTTIYSFLF